MIRGITLKVNDRDFSGRLSTYRVSPEISYSTQLTSINGTEYRGAQRVRDIVEFSLFPGASDDVLRDRVILESPHLLVTYTDAGSIAQPEAVEMTLDTDLDSVFLLNSVDGKTYYRGGTIRLRARRPR